MDAPGSAAATLARAALPILRRLPPELSHALGAQDVLARLAAGANLVQVYTGFVYRGPALLAETLQALRAEP